MKKTEKERLWQQQINVAQAQGKSKLKQILVAHPAASFAIAFWLPHCNLKNFSANIKTFCKLRNQETLQGPFPQRRLL